jgi:hypothetical protein
MTLLAPESFRLVKNVRPTQHEVGMAGYLENAEWIGLRYAA